jgi:hypothetical protein
MRPALPRDPFPLLAGALATAVVAAPWALGFSASHAAVAGHIAFAMAFGPIAVLAGALRAAAAATAIAGAALAAGPWALGYSGSGPAAWGADLVLGLLLVAMARQALRTAPGGGDASEAS